MTIENANPRFPVGLRVLVVDDDPLCLRIVEKMLKRCQYEGAAKIFFPHALALICAIGRRPFGMRRGERARGAGEARGSAERAGTRSKRRSSVLDQAVSRLDRHDSSAVVGPRDADAGGRFAPSSKHK